jgi:hypothetical protein
MVHRLILTALFAIQLGLPQPQQPLGWYDRVMPSWGAIILFALVVFLTWWRERGWKSVAESRKETIGEKDAQILKIQGEKESLIRENQTLHTKTDLAPVNEKMDGWMKEGRDRFDGAMLELKKNHEENSKVVTQLIAEMKAHREASERAFKEITDALTRHVTDDYAAHSENMEHKERFLSVLSGIEERVSLNQQLVMEFLQTMRGGRAAEKNRRRSAQQPHGHQG